ncbi:MAG: glycosyltransferase [Candidatus Omnitrophica bacterium]|nr:glycosyltransferase [Candidatus Omnitrophota bacterium]
METNGIFLSVVICTFRRPGYLSQALKSLTQQDWNCKEGWEVVVVENDNVAFPGVAVILKEYAAKLPLRYFFLPIPNLSRARNLGAEVARGEYLAYLDDDVELTTSWLSAVINGCREYNPDFCGGPSLALFKTERPYWFRESYGSVYMYGDKPRVLSAGEYLGGMNFIVRRYLIKFLGGFREDLAMTAYRLRWGDDSELLQRAREVMPDLKVQYLPDAAVLHSVRPEKMTISWQFKSAYTKEISTRLWNPSKNSRLRSSLSLVRSLFFLFIKIPGLLLVIVLDTFRPHRTLWQRYVKENILTNIVKILIFFKRLF